MKCLDCGWDNAPGAHVCEKCHRELEPPTTEVRQAPASPTAPLRQRVAGAEPAFIEASPLLCNHCGYPMSRRMHKCPNCLSTEAPRQVTLKASKTCPECQKVIDVDDNFCRYCGTAVDSRTLARRNAQGGDGSEFDFYEFTLRPMATKIDKTTLQPIRFTGDTVVLNRSNTDPANPSISSAQQATLVHDNGKWYIENQSKGYTTFLRVNRRTEVRNGDIIVLGNRAFEFKS